MIALQALQSQAERRDRTFQPFEQVDRHQRLKALFAVGLFELAAAAGHLGVVHVLVLLDAAGQDVAHGRIHGQFQQTELVEDVVEANDVRALAGIDN